MNVGNVVGEVGVLFWCSDELLFARVFCMNKHLGVLRRHYRSLGYGILNSSCCFSVVGSYRVSVSQWGCVVLKMYIAISQDIPVYTVII